jgi:hypothetical protein
MPLDILVYPRKVLLVQHAELDFFHFGARTLGSGYDEVEGALEDGGVGDALDGGEGVEGQRFLEAEDDAVREEEEVALSHTFVLVEGRV